MVSPKSLLLQPFWGCFLGDGMQIVAQVVVVAADFLGKVFRRWNAKS